MEYLSLGDEIFCGIQIWSEKELRSDSVPGGTKATHTMGLGIHLLAGMKKNYRELDIVKEWVVTSRSSFFSNLASKFRANSYRSLKDSIHASTVEIKFPEVPTIFSLPDSPRNII